MKAINKNETHFVAVFVAVHRRAYIPGDIQFRTDCNFCKFTISVYGVHTILLYNIKLNRA